MKSSMNTENKRLYVGGLFTDVTQEMLRERFEKFGIVESIGIHKKKNNNDDAYNVFAFLDMKTSPQNINRCIKTYNDTQWNGKIMKLQLAKESFLDRLVEERRANSSSIVKEWKAEEDSEVIKKGIFPNNDVLSSSRLTIGKNNKVAIKTKIGKSKNEKMSVNSDNLNEHNDNNNNNNKLYLNDTERVLSTGRINNDKIGNRLSKREASNLKRLESLQTRNQGHLDQMETIKKSLHSQAGNKKIVFNSDSESGSGGSSDEDDDKVDKEREKSTAKKLSLFVGDNNDGDDDDDDDDNARFEDKSHFEGKQGEKLFRLQTKIKDSRFRLDKRFISEDQSDEGDESSPTNHIKPKKIKLNEGAERSDEMLAERKKALEILHSVVKVRPEKRKAPTFFDLEEMRYDPSQPGHEKFEVKADNDGDGDDIKPSKAKKKKISNKDDVEDDDDDKNDVDDDNKNDDDEDDVDDDKKVSVERYAEVSTSLKDSFKQDKPFKLSSLFENDDDDDDGDAGGDDDDTHNKRKHDDDGDGDDHVIGGAMQSLAKKPRMMIGMFGWDKDDSDADDADSSSSDNHEEDDDDDDGDHDNDSGGDESLDRITKEKNKKKEKHLNKNEENKKGAIDKKSSGKKKSTSTNNKFFFDEKELILNGSEFFKTPDVETLRSSWMETRQHFVDSYRLRRKRYRGNKMDENNVTRRGNNYNGANNGNQKSKKFYQQIKRNNSFKKMR